MGTLDVLAFPRPLSIRPDNYLKPAVLEVLDENQFGIISDSSTSHALIKMLHRWTEATDGSGSTVRVILFDYKKAFDYFYKQNLMQAKIPLYKIIPC
jgi:hypothetical protein